MRIIGGRDYYDSALAYGRDESLVFVRRSFDKAETHPQKESALAPLPKNSRLHIDGGANGPYCSRHRVYDKSVGREIELELSARVAWFAGKRYGGVHVYRYFPNSSLVNDQGFRPEEHVWSKDALLKLLDDYELTLARKDFLSYGQGLISAQSLDEHFRQDPTRAELDWMVANNVATAIWMEGGSYQRREGYIETSGWKINTDGFGERDFARVLDPYTAMQELSMWVGGVLPRTGNATVEIKDDATLLAKHGMDEWSFRRPPKT